LPKNTTFIINRIREPSLPLALFNVTAFLALEGHMLGTIDQRVTSYIVEHRLIVTCALTVGIGSQNHMQGALPPTTQQEVACGLKTREDGRFHFLQPTP
jgi:hypothetical protein